MKVILNLEVILFFIATFNEKNAINEINQNEMEYANLHSRRISHWHFIKLFFYGFFKNNDSIKYVFSNNNAYIQGQ